MDPNRRQLFESGAALLALAAGGGVRVSAHDTLSQLEGQAAALVAGYEREPITATAVRLRRGLSACRALWARGCPASEVVRAHRVTGRLMALWAATRDDLGDPAGAASAFADAFGHANAAGDGATMGWARVWQSSLARLAGRPGDAAELAVDARRWAGESSPVGARAWAMEAGARAALGETRAVHVSVERAWAVVGELSREECGQPGFSLDMFHRDTLAEMTASVYLEAGLPEVSSLYAAASLRELDAVGATGLRSLTRVSLARSAAARGELDEGLALVGEALDGSVSRPSALLASRAGLFVAEARATLGEHPDLDELADRLRLWDWPPETV